MNILKMITISVISGTLLSACSMLKPMPQKPAERWFKEGVSFEDSRTKLAKCRYDVGMNKVEPTEKDSLISSCMAADGYRWGVPTAELEQWETKVKTLRSQGYTLL